MTNRIDAILALIDEALTPEFPCFAPCGEPCGCPDCTDEDPTAGFLIPQDRWPD